MLPAVVLLSGPLRDCFVETRHRRLPGVPATRAGCFACSLVARPFGLAFGHRLRPLTRGRQRAIGPPNILLFIPIADPSPCGGSLRSRALSVPAHFRPTSLWGAKMAGLPEWKVASLPLRNLPPPVPRR